MESFFIERSSSLCIAFITKSLEISFCSSCAGSIVPSNKKNGNMRYFFIILPLCGLLFNIISFRGIVLIKFNNVIIRQDGFKRLLKKKEVSQ